MIKRFIPVMVAVVLAAAGLYFMHKNSQYVKTQVAAIQSEDATATPAADLTIIKSYVSSHMGTSTNFVLTASYNRALTAAQAAQSAAASNAQVYAAAQAACSGKTDSITQAKCNANYLATHLQSQTQSTPTPTPQLADYTYHLSSPLWTPDLAGALLLGGLLALGWWAFTGLPSSRRRRLR